MGRDRASVDTYAVAAVPMASTEVRPSAPESTPTKSEVGYWDARWSELQANIATVDAETANLYLPSIVAGALKR